MSKGKESQNPESGGQHWKNASLPVPRRMDLWLETVGYPLEFQTQAAFAASGFETQQGLHIPLDQGNPSDLDVLASLSSSDGQTRFEVLTECKVLPQPMLAAGFREQQLPLDGPADGMIRTSPAHRLEASRETAEALHQFRASTHGREPLPSR